MDLVVNWSWGGDDGGGGGGGDEDLTCCDSDIIRL